MLHSKSLTIILGICTILMMSFANNAGAQSISGTGEMLWALPSLTCSDFGNQCQVRLSQEGDVYVLWTSGGTSTQTALYVSRYGETTYTEYDLSSYGLQVVERMDFVPFGDQNIVMFYVNSGSATLSRLDLLTGQMELMPQTTSFRRLLECNGYLGRGGNHQHISRLGTGNQLLFCSLSDDATTILVNVMNVVTGATLQTYNLGLAWGGPGIYPLWNMLVGGQDGNIYIDNTQAPSTTIWEQLAGVIPALPSWGWHLFRYEVNSGTWSVRSIVPEQMGSSNYPPSSGSALSRLVAILPNGDIVHQYGWSPSPSDARITEVSLYRPSDFQLMDRISSQESGRRGSFVGVSANGLVLLQSGLALTDLFVEQLEVSTSVFTPTPTSTSTFTATYTPTPTLTPTFTLTPTYTPTSTFTPTSTPTPTDTPTPTSTPTRTPPPTPTPILLPPANTNLLTNPSFSVGSVIDGMPEVTQPTTVEFGVAWQSLNTMLPADTPMSFSVALGNSSAVPKRVQVILRASDWANAAACEFVLPANSALASYSVRVRTASVWNDILAQVWTYAPDGQPAVRIDSADLQYQPALPHHHGRSGQRNDPRCEGTAGHAGHLPSIRHGAGHVRAKHRPPR